MIRRGDIRHATDPGQPAADRVVSRPVTGRLVTGRLVNGRPVTDRPVTGLPGAGPRIPPATRVAG